MGSSGRSGLPSGGSVGQAVINTAAGQGTWQGDTSWTAPTLGNSWANVGGGNQVAGFRKDALGFVHLRGYITGGVAGSVAFVLPAGYRPAATSHFSDGGFNGVDVAQGGTYTYIDNAGQVAPQGGTVTRFSLDGITFYAEN